MSSPLTFSIKKKIPGMLARTGVIETPHGSIQTPAFITVGTKATVKALTPEQVSELGAQAVLANTYHLYLEPGESIVKRAGGLHGFMNWKGPIFTDSGGFQVFSLGAAFSKGVGKITSTNAAATSAADSEDSSAHAALAHIDEDGVTFRSIIDGSEHRFTPERSMQIQHDLGADIIFAFDECTSPTAPHKYQKEAMDRTHRWAERSLKAHKEARDDDGQTPASRIALFGIVQGGRHEDLRKESARIIGSMDFDGFGIGGSFDKEDMYTAVKWVNEILPENKPRHLLGIGEPVDLFGGIENGIDTFDCVAPTRIARNGALYTKDGRINITNARYKEDFNPIESDCECSTCKNYSRAYLSHLFRAEEMLAATLASIHNLHFITHLVDDIRNSLNDDTYTSFKEAFLKRYYSEKADKVEKKD